MKSVASLDHAVTHPRRVAMCRAFIFWSGNLDRGAGQSQHRPSLRLPVRLPVKLLMGHRTHAIPIFRRRFFEVVFAALDIELRDCVIGIDLQCLVKG